MSIIKDENINMEDELRNFIQDLNSKLIAKEDELSNLKEEFEYINLENKRMKKITKRIIEQRNETELFFLDSLNDIKKELYEKQKETSKRGNFFPYLKKGEIDKKEKEYMRNLTPEYREKILKNLFDKINQNYNSENYRELNNIIAVDLIE